MLKETVVINRIDVVAPAKTPPATTLELLLIIFSVSYYQQQ